MEWFQIIEKLVGHLAWPLVFVYLVKVFAGDIKQLVKNIRKAKYKGIELDINSEMRELRVDAKLAGIEVVPVESKKVENDQITLNGLPEWDFMRSWKELEAASFELFCEIHPETKSGQTLGIQFVFNELEKANYIDRELKELILKLREVRNLIAHSYDSSIMKKEATEWLDICNSVKQTLQKKRDALSTLKSKK